MKDMSSGRGAMPYKYMVLLQKIYRRPVLLLCDRTVPMTRRHFLLRQWRDDRTRYLLENGHDHDYMKDKEMEKILHCVQMTKEQPERDFGMFS